MATTEETTAHAAKRDREYDIKSTSNAFGAGMTAVIQALLTEMGEYKPGTPRRRALYALADRVTDPAWRAKATSEYVARIYPEQA